MKNFLKINLPIIDIESDLNKLLSDNTISWEMNQIGINTTSVEPNNYKCNIGSLNYDWAKAYTVELENGGQKLVAPERTVKLTDTDFTTLCTQFKNTSIETLYNILSENFTLGRVRFMKSMPHTCLSWHNDNQIRLHFPIKTQEGCFMVVENEILHLEQNNWYLANTKLKHTAFNGSSEERIHLVVNVLDDYDDIKENR